MDAALDSLAAGRTPERLVRFETLQKIAGFDGYDLELKRLEGQEG